MLLNDFERKFKIQILGFPLPLYKDDRITLKKCCLTGVGFSGL